jgi:phospholipid/cholesterol/gamma-HCH transport system substrate-binding protein
MIGDEPLARRTIDSDEPLARRTKALMGGHRGNVIKVSIFAITMILVGAALVVVFGQFRFTSSNSYHATFDNASRLKTGDDVRIAGIPVGSVKDIRLDGNNKVDVTFTVDKRFQMYTSTEAAIRYLNLVGDRYLEVKSERESCER